MTIQYGRSSTSVFERARGRREPNARSVEAQRRVFGPETPITWPVQFSVGSANVPYGADRGVHHPRDTFVAGRALADTDGLTVELERIIPTGEMVVPYLWVWGEDLRTYEENLEAKAAPIPSTLSNEPTREPSTDWTGRAR